MKCSSNSSSTCSLLVFFGFVNFVELFCGAAMSCIFSCFRVKHASSSTVKKSSPEETTVNRNRSPLSSFLVPEENVRVARKGNGLVEQDLDFEELRNQAKFLKACGTLPQTPPEIGKVAARRNDLSSQKGTVQSLKFRSWLTYTSAENLDLESQQDQLSNFNKDSEEWLDGAGSQEHTPSSCVTLEHNMEGISPDSSEGNMVQNAGSAEVLSVRDHITSESSVSSNTTGPSIPCKNKPVRSDCKLDMYSASTKRYSSEFSTNVSGSAGDLNNVKPCPYPTPLKLSDEMQTPGTVFQANVNDIGKGKYPRIRTQYAPHSAVNPVEGLSESKVLDDGDPFRDKQNHHGQDPFKKSDESEELKTRETSIGSNASVSPLPGTESPNLDGSRSTTVAENLHSVKNPGDRPIIGLVATHWNDTEHSRVSPKWWDGNGIPNSTNKYREDQKVSWIATSFEERLEKALSEENLISQRRQSSGTPPLVKSVETEESDTAMSKLQPSTSHFKPVVSF